MSKFAKYPIITANEFKQLVISGLVREYEHATPQEFYSLIIETGLPKFDKDNLAVFMKGLEGRIYMDTVLVDINDSMFYWMVCGTSAMLVNKPKEKKK